VGFVEAGLDPAGFGAVEFGAAEVGAVELGVGEFGVVDVAAAGLAAGFSFAEGALCGCAWTSPIHSAAAIKAKALAATMPVNAQPRPFPLPCL
jgi:hypothetical protein